MFRDKGFRKSAPIEEGQELELTIEAVGEKGDGIAKSKGFVIFVPGVKEGETVKVRVTKVLRNFGFGEVIGAGTPAKAGKAKAETDEEDGDEDSDEKSDDNGEDDEEDEDEEESESKPSETSESKDSEEF